MHRKVNKGFLLKVKGKVYTSCVISSLLFYGSKTLW